MPGRLARTLVALLLPSAGLLAAGAASAQFPACPPYPLTTSSTPVVTTTGLAVAGEFTPPRAFAGAGTFLQAFDPASGAWGWTVPMGDTIRCQPVPVVLEDGSEVVLVTLAGCRLACVRASDGLILWNDDLRTALPDPQDELAGSPAFQSRAASDSAFQAGVPNDLVFVVTHYVAPYHNRVYAINAPNGSIRWTFNLAGTQLVDPANAGPAVDLARDLVYVGTDQTMPTHNSLWALRSMTGGKAWTGFGVPAGPITQPPLPHADRVYTMGSDAVLRATDCAVAPGTPIWSLTMLNPPASPLVLDPDSSVPLLSFASADHALRFVLDLGSSAAELPPMPGYAAGPVFLPGAGILYTIDTAGRVVEIDTDVQLVIGAPLTLCGDAASRITLSHLPSLASPWRLNVVGLPERDGWLSQLCVPWSFGAAPGSCVAAVPPGGTDAGAREVRLEPPYPNPTRAGARLAFATARIALGELVITDVQGRSIRRLVEDRPAAGGRTLDWDGRDGAGRRLPAGLYSVRLWLDGAPTGDARKVLIVP